MYKSSLFAVAIMLAATAINAQDNKFGLGLKVGGNYSNVYDERGEDFKADPKFGLAAGGFLTVPIGQYFGVQPEVLFSQKGFKGSGTLLGSPYKYTLTTNYIDVPLFLAIKPVPMLSILVGPQFSYLLNQKDDFSVGGENVLLQQEFDNDDLRKNVMSLVGGVDFNVRHVTIGARAGWDLKNNNGDGSSSTPRYKNAWVQGTVGFRIY